LAKVWNPWTDRQQQHLTAVSEVTVDIRHVEGKDNVVADALSRPPSVPWTAAMLAAAKANGLIASVESARVDLGELAAAQEAAKEEMAATLTTITGLVFKRVRFGDMELVCNTSVRQPRPVGRALQEQRPKPKPIGFQ
jgi:hypothetical protein